MYQFILLLQLVLRLLQLALQLLGFASRFMGGIEGTGGGKCKYCYHIHRIIADLLLQRWTIIMFLMSPNGCNFHGRSQIVQNMIAPLRHIHSYFASSASMQ